MLIHAADLFAYIRELLTRPPPISEGDRALAATLAEAGRLAIDPVHQSAIDEVIRREGGYVNHPDDRGGPTNMGITQRTLMDWRGVPVSKDDVKALTREEASAIYHERYIKDTKADLIKDEWVFNFLFDCFVNHRPRSAVLILQKAACVFPQDGLLGPITAGIVNRMSRRQLGWALIRERQLHYARIVEDNPRQAAFIEGWTNRNFELAQGLLEEFPLVG